MLTSPYPAILMMFVKSFLHNSIGRIWKYLPPDPLKRLVNALVISHLHYCNSLLYGLPSNELAKLHVQRVQNTAARLRDLHWLPIPARLDFPKSPSSCLFSTRQMKDFSFLIGVNFSDPKTGCCALTNQRSPRYPSKTELSNYARRNVTCG